MTLSQLADIADLIAAEKRGYGQYLEQGIHITGNFAKHRGGVPNELNGLQDAVNNSLVDLLNTVGGREWWAEYKPKGKLMPATCQNIDAIFARTGP